MSTAKATKKAKPIDAELPKQARRLPVPAAVVGWLRKQQVCDSLGGCSERKLDNMIRAGEFPGADARLGRNPRWSVDLVNEWCREHKTS